MERYELLKYEGRSVRLTYQNEIGLQIRTGVMFSITMEVVVFWPLNVDNEIMIPFKDIKDIELI